MHIGMVGAGRMGSGLARRLVRAGHTCTVYDPNPAAVATLTADGILAAASLPELVAALPKPCTVWIMVPADLTGTVVDELTPLLTAGDVVIDGGNSFYRDAVTRSHALSEHGIHYLDVGTSGGTSGLDRGFCLMIGGPTEPVERLDPIFRALAPGIDAAPRTPGRDGTPAPAEHGYLHCGPAGAGHFAKMIHNGIEYGQMAALAEGMSILRAAGIGVTPTNPELPAPSEAAHYTYDFDVPAILELWRRGSVVTSWLLDLTATAVHTDPDLTEFSGHVPDSGEGRWTARAAIDLAVPAPVLTTALYSRFASRDGAAYANKSLSAMRKAFGGHTEPVKTMT
ncbi:phosphogluconate dehydrogenase (NAD(+)-dependent, decarboxylating) [Nocardia tengchongensis]|uniref:phosphogluconate dehydrogenase (NAD(+)-dependent, decarboxylating) n=1 Tax=Nocardia tengchongensis TaxID=2055889 RepID=UPI00361587D9